jgi:acetyltransferase-like isoleucine patch superfamily enzyme
VHPVTGTRALLLGSMRNCLVFPRCRILVRGSCQLGEWAKIGHHCVIKAGKVEVGDEFWMNHHAEIGGGGWGAGEGSFTVGEHSHVGRYTHVNTARAVVLGRRTAIGMDCTVATHAHWQPGVDGYARRHGAVTLGDDVAVYSRSVISPGVHLGDGCVVAAGSVVVSPFGAGAVAGGVPARLLSEVVVTAEQRAAALLASWDLVASAVSQKDGQVEWTTMPNRSRISTAQGRADARWRNDSLIIEVTEIAPGEPTCRFDLSARTLSGDRSALSEVVRSTLYGEGLRFTRSGYSLPRRSIASLV